MERSDVDAVGSTPRMTARQPRLPPSIPNFPPVSQLSLALGNHVQHARRAQRAQHGRVGTCQVHGQQGGLRRTVRVLQPGKGPAYCLKSRRGDLMQLAGGSWSWGWAMQQSSPALSTAAKRPGTQQQRRQLSAHSCVQVGGPATLPGKAHRFGHKLDCTGLY